MSLFRQGRFLFWSVRELSHKYTKSLIIGIVLGFGLMIGLYMLYPFVSALTLTKIDRIGYIGDYTPSALPLSIQEQLSFGLTTVASDGSALAGIASSWESTDSGKQYTFHLKSDVVWHTGKKVVAQDLNYNIRSVTFTPINDQTIIATLQNTYSPFMTLVSKPIFQANLNGFGSYKVNSIRLKGDKIAFLRLVTATKTPLPTIEYRFYKSEIQAITAYKLGEIDRIEGLTSVESDLRNWKNTQITEVTNYQRFVALYFNLKDPLLREKTFRQALSYAVPMTTAKRVYSPISPLSWAYSDTAKHYDYDMTQATKLFNSTQIATGSGEITIHTFSQYLDIAQNIAQSWNSLGLKTNIRVENVVPKEYQVLLSAQDIPIDPDQYIFWHSTQQEQNQQKRKALYVDFQKRLIDELPVLFLYYPTSYTVERQVK
jgi:ABC-type transport system substrate-binding protein